MTAIEISQTALKSEVSSLRQDTSKIKSMMTEIYQAFKNQPSLAPASSVTPTLSLTNIPANVEGENATNTATEEPPPHIERETKDMDNENKEEKAEEPKVAVPLSSIHPIKVPPTKAQPITTIITHLESSQAAPRPDEGKGIATYTDEDSSKILVPTSNIVRPDPDETKAAGEARLIDMSKPEVIKVVQKEAEKIGLDPKKITSAKVGEKFKKAQDAEHQVLKRELTQRIKRLTKLNKKRTKQYMWTMTNRIKPKPITDVRIYPNTKHVVLSLYRNNDKRNFDVHNPFKFTDIRITKWSNIHKVGVDSLVSYLVMASNVKTEENERFSLKLRKLIAEYPDQEKLQSKRVKLEALGYKMD
ncbi:hypothetical protein Tco_0948971 [Tanacetum coccineum]